MNHEELIPGVGKNSRTVEGSDGTKQAALPYAFHYLDPLALFAMAKVMAEGGEKYGRPEDNWRKIPVEEHLNHMMSHAFAHLAGDTSDDHLEHMACRAMGALQVYLMAKAAPLRDRPQDAATRRIALPIVNPGCRVCKNPMKFSGSTLTSKSYYCFGHGILTLSVDPANGKAIKAKWDGDND